MRAPGAATGVYALECAMDELAVALKIDPLELRYRNYSERDQNADVPFTSKELRECYRRGAEAFGWERRNKEPRAMRDGTELVGWGMATGIWEALDHTITARVVLTANGHAEVACATSDIGTGTYTIMTQVAADMLGLPLENVTARLGDSTLPQSPVEGGSWIASSISNAIAATCVEVRAELLRLAKTMPGSPLADSGPDDVVLEQGRIVSRQDANRAVTISDAMRQGAVDRIEREKTTEPRYDHGYARNVHSAVFAEVKVDEQIRSHSSHPGRQCGRRRAHPQRKDRTQPDPGQCGDGHRHGPARGNPDRSPVRPHHERQFRGILCAGECRCA